MAFPKAHPLTSRLRKRTTCASVSAAARPIAKPQISRHVERCLRRRAAHLSLGHRANPRPGHSQWTRKGGAACSIRVTGYCYWSPCDHRKATSWMAPSGRRFHWICCRCSRFRWRLRFTIGRTSTASRAPTPSPCWKRCVATPTGSTFSVRPVPSRCRPRGVCSLAIWNRALALVRNSRLSRGRSTQCSRACTHL